MSLAVSPVTSPVLYAALDYAKRGFPVFPCNPHTKQPLVPCDKDARGEDIRGTGGLYKATRDAPQIVTWWTQWPNAMIGIPCGPRSGVWGLDPDAPERPTDPDGRAEWAKLQQQHGKAPATHTHETPGGGEHLVFKYRQDKPVTNREGGIRKRGINVRGQGGYLIFPPSVASSGRAYAIKEPLDAFNFAEAPDWLYDLILTKPEPSISERAAAIVRRPSRRSVVPYVAAALQGEVDKVAAAGHGERNNALNSAAFSLGTLVGAGELTEGDVVGALLDAAAASGLTGDDGHRSVMATINSGLQSGIQHPRQIAERDHVNDSNPPRMDAPTIVGATGVTSDRTGPGSTPKLASIVATPYSRVDPKTLPMRDKLMGNLLIRKFVSATVAPGGVGKTLLTVAETLSMTSGRALVGTKPKGRLRVWLWNLEDPFEETQRQIEAAALHYNLQPEDSDGWLFVNSGRDTPLVIAKTLRNGAVIVQPVVDNLVAEMIAKQIDVLTVDPFVSSHEVAENDNTFQDMIIKEWGRVADRANAAVHLVDHTRKMGGLETEVTVESSRGAKAKTDGCRVVRVVNRMTEQEAERAGVENRRLHFRTYNDKDNLAPPADKSDWFKLIGVDLGNGPLNGAMGDSVGVVTSWDWPDVMDELHSGIVDKIFDRIKTGRYRENPQSEDWVGRPIADVMGLNLENRMHKAKIKGIIKNWKDAGSIVTVDGKDKAGKTKSFVEVSEAAQ